ncbi:serine dehydratase subunit alpha family protein [Photobacterium angustum]|uniref:L-cysteine desulfidase family protein n=1 Tax=Photobacterium angustum TaxID=661 RepID=UPI0005E969B2|nr:L-serine ammonia-lyase, iron-sulfur-dependent, subunit alpha [Photobacterium angustum]KJG01117.1 membrane protein [Photobacterium angustum]PSV69508.1 serine dehydratase subunit alpha family protein [Photobacterium angustum]
MKTQWQQYKNIINTVVKPAFGCTEPISAAYASAVVAELLGRDPEELDVKVSDNLFKNSMGVFVPGTGRIGLPIASAAGAIGGNPNGGLEVLVNITPEHVEKAQQLIDAGKVTAGRKDVEEFIYCEVTAKAGNDVAVVEISGGHTQVVKKTLNGKVVFDLSSDTSSAEKPKSTASVCEGVDISLKGIYDFATQVEFEEIAFMVEAYNLTVALSNEGLENEYGLQIGRTFKKHIESGLVGNSLTNRAIMRSAAASDARMGGATLPAMSNYGSGNQGICASMPVIEFASHYEASEETMTRALIMSHLAAVYMKSFYPPLSPFCGCAVTSSAAAMAMTYLAGGTFEQSCMAIQNTLSDTTGMFCDGAKSTCAMKVKSSTSSAVMSTLMALDYNEARCQGIVADDVEKTIRNVGKMVREGMANTDKVIIEIMSA